MELCLLLCVAIGIYWVLGRREARAPVEVYEGVTYRCEDQSDSAQGSGLIHVLQVDLRAPGVELYLTPVDVAAAAAGWEYRLRFPGRVLAQENLAAVVNGTLFTSRTGPLALPGAMARSGEMIVVDGAVNHVDSHSYLLWFEADLTPHVCRTTPPPAEVLRQARWGIAGQEVVLQKGASRPDTLTMPNTRTMLAINTERRLLWIAVFEDASFRMAADYLGTLGAQDGIMLDGGASSAMLLGDDARGVRAGSVLGGWRPVPTHFGVRARALPSAASFR